MGLTGVGGGKHKIVVVNATYYGTGTGNVANYTFEFRYFEGGKLVEDKVVGLYSNPSFVFHGVRISYDVYNGTAAFNALNDCVLLSPNGGTVIKAGGLIATGLYTGYRAFSVLVK